MKFLVSDAADNFWMFLLHQNLGLMNTPPSATPIRMSLVYRGTERNFGLMDKNFVWALWSVVSQNHVMGKKGHSLRRCLNFGPK